MQKSASFVQENPHQADVWVLRAATAVEINREPAGREAAAWLFKLGLDSSQDPKTRKLLASLERNGWLYDKSVTAETELAAVNQLLKDGGVINWRKFEKIDEGAIRANGAVTYGALAGDCQSGFDLPVQQTENEETDPWRIHENKYTESTTKTASYRFEPSSPGFLDTGEPDYQDKLSAEAFLVRNLYSHNQDELFGTDVSGKRETKDSKPADGRRSLWVYYNKSDEGRKLLEHLKKLYWACKLQPGGSASSASANGRP